MDWGDLGRAQLLTVAEQAKGGDYVTRFYTSSQPEGKWVLVIFGVLDSNVTPTVMMNLGYDILRLDGYEPTTNAAFGASLDPGIMEFRLTEGLMGFFFDVPEDYDLSKGVVTVSGTVMTVAGDEHDPVFDQIIK